MDGRTPRQAAPRQIVSVGYGGRRRSELVQQLVDLEIDVLVDVRLHPVSGIPGYSGTSLERCLGDAGIAYRHEKDLGNPLKHREGYREGLSSARRAFTRRLTSSGRPAVARLAELARTQRVAVLCAERDPCRCHRQAITRAALRLDPALSLVEL